MKTKEIYSYISKNFHENDWIHPPLISFSKDCDEYVQPNKMKKSKQILFSSCSESDSILFLIQTISKNIIFHIMDSECDSFIHFFQNQLTWIEKGAIQRIYICHSQEIKNIEDYLEYLLSKYQLSKTFYLGTFSKDVWIGLTPQGIFTSHCSKL